MPKVRCSTVILFGLIGLASLQAQTGKFTAAQAKDHVGKRATVCGTVASARYVEKSKGQPTFLNLDEPYPKQIFTILIWGNDRSKFGAPEDKYRDTRLCATGLIKLYREVPEIEASDPSQIEVQK
jgi:hypothetical protein